ncbi:MBL fold metallo-hydrolase [Clostridium bowmanii]|uniref:MBL fold metallo-hydrolase n=1 Tax=Clostridium bowmanii TaxID=132925 RepID=UPI001C0D74D0|nr:MBL fold metallo-hydrolase [Clostridium bowmanii]MBU3188017.1 MBL fold metallo-hydrolase [Clostridium bowmanii]MCA1072196.1 MBL fold metallo-hydrolase [Clostridium bowmanii]
MSEIQAKIYYIYHSGFAIKTKNHFLIFDYFKEPLEKDETHHKSELLSSENIKNMKNVFVFATHSHADHFNSRILEWEKYNRNIKYIFSEDIKISVNKPSYSFMEEGEEKSFEGLYVKAYGSTDIGISFLVKVDGLTIFHAGDLNWWHWKEDSAEEQSLAESSFKAHIEKLKEEKPIDIAFFPVDSRLQEFYCLGGDYFSQEINPDLFIPMHFGDDVGVTKKFVEKMKKRNIKAVEINYSGQEIIY